VRTADDSVIIVDAGTGIRRLGATLNDAGRIDVLLSHLHTDHIQGLGFFGPLFEKDREVHIWGPRSAGKDLRARLARYLSEPLFPVHLRELPSHLVLHDVPFEEFAIQGVRIQADLIVHPGPTVGYRISEGGSTLVYLSDHEPVLGDARLPAEASWTSGFALAAGADVLIHDAQYTDAEYQPRVGWGHSSISQAIAFGRRAGVRRFVTFHHDPDHSDAELDHLHARANEWAQGDFELIPGVEGLSIKV
jgi:phosphoribosyl 1,2-cyclic phosphodiesterase